MNRPPQRTRVRLAQNLFRSRAAADRLVRGLHLDPGDVVHDLGAGTGMITGALVAAGARVVAVERDPNLARKLCTRFADAPVRVVEADLRTHAYAPPFKVVANPPFNLTADILRRLLVEGPHPEACALALQREAAESWAGTPRPTARSLSVQPWFGLEVIHAFARHDFVPKPAVDVSLLRVTRRAEPLLPHAQQELWRDFVAYAFARQAPDARRMLRNVLSNLQWRRLSHDLGVPPGAARGDLTLAQWVGLFRFVLAHTPEHRRPFGRRNAPPGSARRTA